MNLDAPCPQPNTPSDSERQTRALLSTIWEALDLSPSAADRLHITTSSPLPSAFAVTELATASIGAAALAVTELLDLRVKAAAVAVDQRLASLWFGWSIRPVNWDVPPAWDAIAGDYRTGNGWIRLHTNASAHRAAALNVLGCKAHRTAVEKAVEAWTAEALEQAIVDAGGCAATMRTQEEWAQHPQGQAVAAEPLVSSTSVSAPSTSWRPTHGRPLQGLKVLDLTRILAGPVATRFLAAFGADVLRIDPPGWDEPAVIPEVTLGKRCAVLDLHSTQDRHVFERLLSEAHVLIHGYRPGALDRLGYDATHRRSIAPGLIDLSLDAYGWSGPWRERRGFDSLVQMSTGIAAVGMTWRNVDRPLPLPVQALDHATGYLLAAAAVRRLISRLRDGQASTVRVSLARTAHLLHPAIEPRASTPFDPPLDADYASGQEQTAWGPAQRLRPPIDAAAAPMRWDVGASRLGTAAPEWR